MLGVFRDAVAAGVALTSLARAVCRAQPSMASVWNAALEVVASDRPAERLEAFWHDLALMPLPRSGFSTGAARGCWRPLPASRGPGPRVRDPCS